MPVMLPPTGPIEVSDPNNVPEIFVSGPFNIMNAGGIGAFHFTAARPDASDLLKGERCSPGFQAIVACRLVMPLEMAQQMSRTLAGTFSKLAQPIGTMPEIVTRLN